MPTLNKQFTLEITPEQFLNNCSVSELIETQLLLSSARYQNKIADADDLLQANFLPNGH
jgi:hypothetical protein